MEKIVARMIVEIMGRPPEHIIYALDQLVDRVSKEPGVTVTGKNTRPAVPVKDSKDLFSSFTEVEIEFDSIITCLRIVLTYLPANIEIITPESLRITNDNLTTIANALAARIHDYDAIAKRIVIERNNLLAELKVLRAQKGAPVVAEQPVEKKAKKPKRKKKKK